MAHTALAFSGLGAAWFLWSGYTDPLILSLGAVSCVLVWLISRRLNIIDRESAPLHLAPRFLAYLPWLLWEILRANLHVARVVLSPGLPVRPQLIRVQATQNTDVGRAIFANSITLTPGTVSLDVRDGTILVHALDDSTAAGLSDGEMDRRVTVLEGES